MEIFKNCLEDSLGILRKPLAAGWLHSLARSKLAGGVRDDDGDVQRLQRHLHATTTLSKPNVKGYDVTTRAVTAVSGTQIQSCDYDKWDP
jgi:hypothetical protein